ncbi:HTH-like domain-containing protein [Marinovum sp. KMM 9989]
MEFKKRYHAAANGMTVVTIHLFGIEFARELDGHNLKQICADADVPTSYGTELRKGMRLAEFVTLK